MTITLLPGSACSNNKSKSETASQPPISISAAKMPADFEKNQDAAAKTANELITQVASQNK